MTPQSAALTVSATPKITKAGFVGTRRVQQVKRWALFIGLAACAAVAVGCGKQAAAPDPTRAAISAECHEALRSYLGLAPKAPTTDLVGDCDGIAFRSVDEPQEWQRVRETVHVLNPDPTWPGPAMTDTEKVVKDPPNKKPVAQSLEYGPWQNLSFGALDPQGKPFLGPETSGLRYLPLYRWGCEAPFDPESTFRCALNLSVATRLRASHQLRLNHGIDRTERELVPTLRWDGYPAAVASNLDRSGEDHTWHVAELRDFRTYLIRDVYHCKHYVQPGIGLARHQVYCQLAGHQYQPVEALEVYNVSTYTLAELRQHIEENFPGVVITPEAQTLLSDLEALLHGNSFATPMPKGVSCQTNVRCQSHIRDIEVTAPTLNAFGLSVAVSDGQPFRLSGTGGLTIKTESAIAVEQHHSLEFEARGRAHELVRAVYRQSVLPRRGVVGSFYVDEWRHWPFRDKTSDPGE